MVQGVFDHPGAEVFCFYAQYFVFVVEVYIPSNNSLQVVEVRTNVVNVFAVAQVGFENEDIHI